MRSKLSYWCDGLIEAGILLAIILAPLFFNIHSDRVFEPDKLTLVRSLAVLMSVAWLVKFVDGRGWREAGWLRWNTDQSIWRLPFVLPILLLVIVYLLSTLFSVVPRVSWAGSYQRLQGTYSTLSYIVIFALAASTIRRWEQINRIVTTVIITSLPISLYGLLQHYGLDPLPWGGNVQRRIAANMGNAIFVSAYLIMAIPLTLARIIDAFTNILGDEELDYADVIRSSVYIFTFAVQLVAMYWSYSRGPLIGWLVSMFAMVLILLVSLRNAVSESGRFRIADAGWAAAMVVGVLVAAGGILYFLLTSLSASGRLESLAGPMTSFVAFVGAVGVVALAIGVMVAARRGWRWLWIAWLFLALIGVAWIGVFNIPPESASQYREAPVLGNVLETMSEWRDLPGVGRFGTALEADQGTGRVRVLIWEGALDLLAPHDPLAFPDGEEDSFNLLRPLLGYGPESMYVAYNRFYLPELATVEARNASPDRSHNETFDALIITGALGFLVWQALYLSVFYYGFRWLGVVRTSRDRNLLLIMWVLGAALGAIVLTQWLGPVFLGVAIPFGSIGGLVIYLCYYALFSSTGAETPGSDSDPFAVRRLLMLGLVAAVVAHYVEIHFGIAIAATRVHFFVYVALMFLVGHLLPMYGEQPATGEELPVTARTRRRRRWQRGSQRPGWVSPVLAATFILTIIIAVMGYEFMNYSRPPDAPPVRTLEDVPSAAQIFHQALFVNQSEGFVDSPFLFLVIGLTWSLGALASLSEMAKQGIIKPTVRGVASLAGTKSRYAALIFVGLIISGVALRFVPPPDGGTSTAGLLGWALLLLWSLISALASLRLFQEHPAAHETAGVVATVGLLFSFPLLIAGAGLFGTLLLLGCAAVLYLLWQRNWNELLLPAIVLSLVSLVIGLGYGYLQAAQIRNAIFLTPPQPTEIDRLIFTADQFASFLTVFYTFIIGMMLLAAFILVQRTMGQTRNSGSPAGFVVLGIGLVLALFIVNTTNLRIIQADIVYKQARPLDRQATRAGSAEAWDAPIAIYEHSIELAPLEDFYYLFLGRAYLEKSAVAQNPAEQQQLLDTAKDRLQTAQEINPLNTDHTANLARLTTRWASLSGTDAARQEQLIEEAKGYYRDALSLSPQNSVIRNEYANLLATLDQDCDAAINTFEESIEIDPFFATSYLSLASVYQSCASELPAEEQDTYLRRAAEVLEEGAEESPRNRVSLLLQAAQLHERIGDYEDAIAALEQAKAADAGGQLTEWSVNFSLAQIYNSMGDLTQARELAELALAQAPPENREAIQTFLSQLGGNE